MKNILIILFTLFASAIFAQTKVTAPIVRNNPADIYPTHIDSLGQGGLIVFSNITSRDALPVLSRKIGMMAAVSDSANVFYQLQGGILNSDWVRLQLVASTDSSAYFASGYVNTQGFYIEDRSGRRDTIYFTVGQGSSTVLLSGSVVWISGFDFQNTPLTYLINGSNYSAAGSSFSITGSDTLDRFTIVVVDTLGVVYSIDGSPFTHNTPIAPAGTLLLATYFVPAGSSQPSLITNTDVYTENGPWILSGTVTGLSGAYITLPYAGTYSTRVPSVINGEYFTYTNGAVVSASDFDYLSMRLKLLSAFNSSTTVSITFMNGINPVSNSIILTDGTHGYNQATPGSYQFVAFSISEFNFTNVLFDNIRFDLTGSNAGGLQLDNVILQSGGVNNSTSGVLSVDNETGHVTTNFIDTAILDPADSLNYILKHKGVTRQTLPTLYNLTIAKSPLEVISKEVSGARYDSLGIRQSWIDSALSGAGATSGITWSVLDSLSTPSVTAVNGNKYLVGTSPTGAFTGHANEIATYNGTSYTFASATVGDLLYNTATNIVSQWTGTDWVRVSTPIPSGAGNTNYLTKWTGISSLGTSLVYDDGVNLGVGTITPASKLDIYNSTSTANVRGLNFENTTTSPTGFSNFAANFKANIAPSSSSSGDYGGISAALDFTNSNVNSGRYNYGMNLAAYNSGSGAISAMYGLQSQAGNSGSGSVNEAVANRASLYDLGGTIVNGIGYRFSGKIFNIGTVENAYGLYMDPVTFGTNTNHAIYIAGGASHFEDGIGIGTTNIPVASALLDIGSTSKGALIPRMTNTQMQAISSPANGLLVTNTDSANRIFLYDGSAWRGLSFTTEGVNIGNSDLTLTGNRTLFLDEKILRFEHDGNPFLIIDPTAGEQSSSIQSFDITGGGNSSYFNGYTEPTFAQFTIGSQFNSNTTTNSIIGVTNATSSNITYTADKHIFPNLDSLTTAPYNVLTLKNDTLKKAGSLYFSNSTTSANGLIKVNNTNAGYSYGIVSSVVNGQAVHASGGSGIGVYSDNSNVGFEADATGIAVWGISNSGQAIVGNTSSGLSGTFNINSSNTNGVLSHMEIQRYTTGTSANGIGQQVDFVSQMASGGTQPVNSVISRLTDATDATVTSEYSIVGVNNGTSVGKLLTLAGNGVGAFHYGSAVASTSTITATGNLFHVTGTTNITSVDGTGITAGSKITIIFDGILTFTDGSNLKLATSFVTTADATITLVYDGSNWYEVSRSTN